jgi:integrase
VRTLFAHLQERGLSPSRQHQAYRTLKTFFHWCIETGVLHEDPLRSFAMRTPKTLPEVPTDDELRRALLACPHILEGLRNRAMLLVLADSALRASELLHLLVEDWRASDRGLFVHAGKGRKDRIAFIGPTTTRALKTWLAHHPQPTPEAFLFTDRHGCPSNIGTLYRSFTGSALRPGSRIIAGCTRTHCVTSRRQAGYVAG